MVKVRFKHSILCQHKSVHIQSHTGMSKSKWSLQDFSNKAFSIKTVIYKGDCSTIICYLNKYVETLNALHTYSKCLQLHLKIHHITARKS